jgi:hypothetical protein
MKVFLQSSFDGMCGIFSLINAYRVIHKASDSECQVLFNQVIDYLSKKRKLKEVILEGVNHKLMLSVMNDVIGDSFPNATTNLRNFTNINEWWYYTKDFLDTKEHSAVILSVGGKIYHLTTVVSMSDKKMFLHDSTDGQITLAKRLCKLVGYSKTDKYIIYPSQCIYIYK